MANPKAHTLIDVFLPDGFGAFGFGSGGFGGNLELLNPQWNTVAGSFGFDTVVGLPYVEATSTPSYVGATPFDITYDSFFAKIIPAPAGNGNIQTALIVRADARNYVEISVGPQGSFNFYVSNNTAITLPSQAMPAYNSTNHAFWRIRNDNILFYFDTSPDGSTWTNQGSLSYSWDATSVTVMFFSGFNGSENPGNRAYISNVNLPGTTLALSSKGSAHAAAAGIATVTTPFQLTGRVNGKFGVSAKFTASLGIPEGGLTDFIYTGYQNVDPIITDNFNFGNSLAIGTFNSDTSLLRSDWNIYADAETVPVTYRDGSYFPPARYVEQVWDYTQSAAVTGSLLWTSNQTEFVTGFSNRLPFNSTIYSTGTFYSPGPGVSSVTRATSPILNGQFSGQIQSNNSPLTLGNGQLGYFIWPTSVTLVPILVNTIYYAQVALSTQRANTQWFASFIFYDANFNVLSGSTYLQASITNINTHPGSGAWQTGAANLTNTQSPSNAAYMAVVPVVINPSSLVETVYTSNPAIYTGAPRFTEQTTAYNNPNTQNINIKAERVNYVLNGGFNSTVNLYSQVNTGTSGTPNPVTLSWDGTTGYQTLGSAKVTFVAPSGTFTGTGTAKLGMGTAFVFNGSGATPVIQGLKVGHTYTISAWIQQGPGCPDVFMNCTDQNGTASANGVTGVSTNASKSAGNTVNGWTQISGTFTVPFNGLPDMGLFFYVNYTDFIGNPNFSFWVDGILLEESNSVNSFFDGNTATADYQWESGGTANAARSYYYSNYTNKLANLNSALPSVLPVGSSYNLQFAQPIQPL